MALLKSIPSKIWPGVKSLYSKFENQFQTGGTKLNSKNEKASSTSDNPWNKFIEPSVPFKTCRNYYRSIPRIFNTTESIVLDVRNRDHHYSVQDKDGTGDDKENHEIELMENWDKKTKPKEMVTLIVRNLLVCGVHIVSKKDWLPLQLAKVEGKKRDDEGNTTHYIKSFKGQPEEIDATQFVEISYIKEDREPWALGKFHSLFYKEYNDIDGNPVHSLAQLHRQALLDTMKIHHKYASPRVFYNVEGVTKTVLDEDIVPVIESMEQGSRAAFNAKVEPILETVDTHARFHESVINIQKEIDIGTGSVINRLITEPSAMADAREAGESDDDQILGIMDIIKTFFDNEVIPRVTGNPETNLKWEWGAKDSFRIEMPDYIEKAIKEKLITKQKAIQILRENHNWPEIEEKDIPEDMPMPTQPCPGPGETAAESHRQRILEKQLEQSTAALQLELVKEEKKMIEEAKKNE